VACSDHLDPFQRSASVSDSPTLFAERPTAVQASLDEHDTADRPLSVLPAGLGAGWIDHATPFQRSASVTPMPELFTYCPTAGPTVVEGHEPPASPAPCAPAGAGMLWSVHLVLPPATAAPGTAAKATATPIAAKLLLMLTSRQSLRHPAL